MGVRGTTALGSQAAPVREDPRCRARECTYRLGSSCSFVVVIVRAIKCDLGPYRNGVELRAGVASADRTYLSGDVTMQVVEQETGIAINVPVQTSTHAAD